MRIWKAVKGIVAVALICVGFYIITLIMATSASK